MNILVTSIVDLERVPFNRIHVLLRHLSLRHEITVACLNAWWLEKQNGNEQRDPCFRPMLEKVRIVYFVEKRIPPILQEMLSVGASRKRFEEGGADYDLHVNYGSLVAGLATAKALQTRGVPTILDLPDDLPAAFQVSPRVPFGLRRAAGRVSEALLRANVRIASQVTFITKALQSRYALPPDKSILLPNGFDAKLFSVRPAAEARRRLGLAPGDFVLGFVGILAQEWVDFSPVFASVRELAVTIPALKLLIVGNGEGAAFQRGQAARQGIGHRVHFTGRVAHGDVPWHIACMDVCLIPFADNTMTNHALPIKLLEYLACGRPVISIPTAGVVETAEAGVLYAADQEGWTRRIVQLYEDPALRARLGAEGRAWVVRDHSWSRICRTFEDALNRATSKQASLAGKGL